MPNRQVSRGVMVTFDVFSRNDIEEINSKINETIEVEPAIKKTAIFGGSEINLSRCKLAEGKNIIDVFMIFGGSNIVVPPDWSIKIDVLSIFGGFSDKRQNFTDESKKENKELYIKGLAIFGGGEIKNY